MGLLEILTDFISKANVKVDWTKVDRMKLALHACNMAQEIAKGTSTEFDDMILGMVESSIRNGTLTVFESDKVREFAQANGAEPGREGRLLDFINSPLGTVLLTLLKKIVF